MGKASEQEQKSLEEPGGSLSWLQGIGDLHFTYSCRYIIDHWTIFDFTVTAIHGKFGQRSLAWENPPAWHISSSWGNVHWHHLLSISQMAMGQNPGTLVWPKRYLRFWPTARSERTESSAANLEALAWFFTFYGKCTCTYMLGFAWEA